MEDVCLIKKSTLTELGDAIRGVLNTTDTYTPQQMISLLKGEGSGDDSITPPVIVDGTTLVNYDIEFSFSSSSVTIVVIYSTWTDDGIIITTKDISTTTTLQILQNSTFTIMGVDGTYSLKGVTCSDNISDIRSIASGYLYSYVFSCNGDGSVYFSY